MAYDFCDSVPEKLENLMSLSMMTVMKTFPYPERKRGGRAVAVNKMAKKKTERRKRRSDEGEILWREMRVYTVNFMTHIGKFDSFFPITALTCLAA